MDRWVDEEWMERVGLQIVGQIEGVESRVELVLKCGRTAETMHIYYCSLVSLK